MAKNLVTDNPILVNNWWDFDSNQNIDPNKIKPHSRIKVYWHCPKGHSFLRSVAQMNSKKSKRIICPVCSGAHLVKGVNDLASQMPELLTEWDFERNGSLKPEEVSASSTKSVSWIHFDEKSMTDHRWTASPRDRRRGRGCPICNSHTCQTGRNDFVTMAIKTNQAYKIGFWDAENNTKDSRIPDTPNCVSYQSHKKAHWVCERGHHYTCEISRVFNSPHGSCSQCKKEGNQSFPQHAIFYYLKQIDQNCIMDADLNTLPWLERFEIDIYLPTYGIGVEYDGPRHKSRTESDNRKSILCREHQVALWRLRLQELPKLDGDDRCIYLKNAGNQALETGIECLIDSLGSVINCKKPSVNIQKDYSTICEKLRGYRKTKSVANDINLLGWWSNRNSVKPSTVNLGSNRKYWWKCKQYESHVFDRSPKQQAISNNCPYCAGERVLPGFNDFGTVAPKQLIAEYSKENEIPLTKLAPYSNRKVKWQHVNTEAGIVHEWQASPADRMQGNGCPICAGKQILVGSNDLATVNPDLAAEWHPTMNGDLKPTEFTKGSGKKVWWQCSKCGEAYLAKIANRTSGFGCPYCAGQKPIIGKNDLATVNPDLAAEWHPTMNGDLKPTEFTKRSGKKVWWQCNQGHPAFQESISNRNRDKQGGCPYCIGKKAIPGKSDLFSIYPDLQKWWDFNLNSNLNPNEILPHSAKVAFWHDPNCKYGHTFKRSVNNMVKAFKKQKPSCPFCSNKRVLTGFNDLQTQYPQIAKLYDDEKNDLKSSEVVPGSGKKAWFLDESGKMSIREKVAKELAKISKG